MVADLLSGGGRRLTLPFEPVDRMLMSLSSLEVVDRAFALSSSSVSSPETSRLKPMLVFGLEGGGRFNFSRAWDKVEREEVGGGCETRENVKDRASDGG